MDLASVEVKKLPSVMKSAFDVYFLACRIKPLKVVPFLPEIVTEIQMKLKRMKNSRSLE